MSDTTQTLADYIRAENAKEREADGLEGSGAPLPTAEPVTASEAAEAEPFDATIAASSDAETPAADVDTPADRDANGQFKAKGDKVQARIDKAVKAQREAERRAEAAEAKAREIEARQSRPEPTKVESQPAASGKPLESEVGTKYATYGDYMEALTDWKVSERLRADQVAAAERQSRDEAAKKNTASDSSGREQFPDWDDVMSSEFASTFLMPTHLIAAIRDSDQSAALRYYLVSHPDEARQMASDLPFNALMSLGKLAARLTPASNGSGSESVVHSKAKPLTKPLRGSTPSALPSGEPDPDKTSFADWMKIGNARDRARRDAMRGA